MPFALKAKIGALLFEASNPRHAHEWTTFRDAGLPQLWVVNVSLQEATVASRHLQASAR